MKIHVTYGATDDKDVLLLIDMVRKGIRYPAFSDIAHNSPFTINEWCRFLYISERTMQRYQREKKTFDAIHSERILQITMLIRYGAEVFGNNEKFSSWLEAVNVALGNIKPKELLDSSFGIGMLKDELSRIEQGILS